MQVRHRTPSIFNLSMVDVFCCALGCVILLWLVNLREAKHHEESAEEEHRRITTELAGIRAERDNANDRKMQLQERLEALEKDKDDLQKVLDAKRAEAADLSKRLKTSGQRINVLEADVRDRKKRYETEMARAEAMEKDLRLSEKRGDKETARSKELAADLIATRRRAKEFKAMADLVPSLQDDLKDARRQYAAEKALASTLEKEIAKRMRDLKDADNNLEKVSDSRRSLERGIEARDKEMAALRQQNKTLQGESARVRAAAEQRFAGIALTGRRVLFLIDMSGSMDLVDESTKAPTKWADVRNTIARLMSSLPNLEKYQAIVFAEKSAFLFEGQEDWLDFQSQSSPQRVRDALAKIVPKGGTNMYAALQLAFRLRAKSLLEK